MGSGNGYEPGDKQTSTAPKQDSKKPWLDRDSREEQLPVATTTMRLDRADADSKKQKAGERASTAMSIMRGQELDFLAQQLVDVRIELQAHEASQFTKIDGSNLIDNIFTNLARGVDLATETLQKSDAKDKSANQERAKRITRAWSGCKHVLDDAAKARNKHEDGKQGSGNLTTGDLDTKIKALSNGAQDSTSNPKEGGTDGLATTTIETEIDTAYLVIESIQRGNEGDASKFVEIVDHLKYLGSVQSILDDRGNPKQTPKNHRKALEDLHTKALEVRLKGDQTGFTGARNALLELATWSKR